MCRKIWMVCVAMMGLLVVQSQAIENGIPQKDTKKTLRKSIKRESRFTPPIPQRKPFQKPPIPYSTGKEEYIGEVVISFSSALRKGHTEPGPYDLGIYEWGETGGMVAGPSSIAIDGDNNIYILDVENSWIRVYSNDGRYVKTIDMGRHLGGTDIYVDNEKNIYVFDPHPPLFPYMREYEPPHKEGFGPKGYHLFEIRKYSSEGNLIARSCSWLPDSLYRKLLPQVIYVDNSDQIYLGRGNLGILRNKGKLSIREMSTGIPVKIGEEDLRFSYGKQDKETVVSLENRHTKSVHAFLLPLSLGKLGRIDIIGADKHANLYLDYVMYQKDTGFKEKVIKVDRAGNILTEIGPFPSTGGSYIMTRKMVVDNEGCIYWLRYWASGNNEGGELVKFHRRR